MISSESSDASDSTISTPSLVPATTRSKVASLICSILGFRIYWFPSQPTLQAPIGPINGNPEMVKAADAPIIAKISGSFSISCARTVAII